MKKTRTILLGIGLILLGVALIYFFFFYNNEEEVITNKFEIIEKDFATYNYLNDYNDYQDYLTSHEGYNYSKDLLEEDFNNKKYVIYEVELFGCGESVVSNKIEKEGNTYKVYIELERSCGVCAPYHQAFIYEVEDNTLKVEGYSKYINNPECDEYVVYKPMIYIYPEQDIDLTIKLGKEENIKSSYPKYKNEWNLKVSKDSNIYDIETNRNYYGLFYDVVDNYNINLNEGFVVKGEDTVSFLEEKLSILGLSEREINEFIVYWIDKLESNYYNFISFRSQEDINDMMPLSFSKEPDTLIRVIMDYKPLEEPIKTKEQKLTKVERSGYTIVEWGGKKH